MIPTYCARKKTFFCYTEKKREKFAQLFKLQQKNP